MALNTYSLLSAGHSAGLTQALPTIPPLDSDGNRQPVTDGIGYGKRNENAWLAFHDTTNDVSFSLYGLHKDVWFLVKQEVAIGILNNSPCVYELSETMLGFERLYVKADADPGGTTPIYRCLSDVKV